MAGVITSLLLFGLVFAGAELLHRHGVEVHLTRKIVHIGGAVVAALLPWLISLPLALVSGLFFQQFYSGAGEPAT